MKHAKTALANNLGFRNLYAPKFCSDVLLMMPDKPDVVRCEKVAWLWTYLPTAQNSEWVFLSASKRPFLNTLSVRNCYAPKFYSEVLLIMVHAPEWARAKRWSGWVVIRCWKSVHHTFLPFWSNFKRPFLNNFSVRKSHATPLQGRHLLTMGRGRVVVLSKKDASLGSYLLLNSWSPYISVFLKITFTFL